MKIHFFIILLIIICFFGCSSSNTQKLELNNKNTLNDSIISIENTNTATLISDSLVYIDLGENVIFQWNNNSSEILYDSLYQKIVDDFFYKQKYIITLILDTSITPAIICSYNKNLRVGDLVFLLLDNICDIPFFVIFKRQLDFSYDCRYPLGLIETITFNRKLVYENLINNDSLVLKNYKSKL